MSPKHITPSSDVAAISKAIEDKTTWENLPKRLKAFLGNEAEWGARTKDYCTKKRYAWHECPAKMVCNENEYYEGLLRHLRKSLAMFPYHLAEVVCGIMHVSPFQYYREVIYEALKHDRPYSKIPRLAAADASRVTGIRRDEFTSIMNRCKAKKQPYKLSRSLVVEYLPAAPKELEFQPWWQIAVVNMLPEDYMRLTPGKQHVVDRVARDGPTSAAEFDCSVVQGLYRRGLVYVVVPVFPGDRFSVSSTEDVIAKPEQCLEDPIEELLYGVFMTAMDNVTVAEMATTLQADLWQVEAAFSLACRLGLARKVSTALRLSRKESAPASAVNGFHGSTTRRAGRGGVVFDSYLPSAPASSVPLPACLAGADADAGMASSSASVVDSSLPSDRTPKSVLRGLPIEASEAFEEGGPLTNAAEADRMAAGLQQFDGVRLEEELRLHADGAFSLDKLNLHLKQGGSLTQCLNQGGSLVPPEGTATTTPSGVVGGRERPSTAENQRPRTADLQQPRTPDGLCKRPRTPGPRQAWTLADPDCEQPEPQREWAEPQHERSEPQREGSEPQQQKGPEARQQLPEEPNVGAHSGRHPADRQTLSAPRPLSLSTVSLSREDGRMLSVGDGQMRSSGDVRARISCDSHLRNSNGVSSGRSNGVPIHNSAAQPTPDLSKMQLTEPRQVEGGSTIVITPGEHHMQAPLMQGLRGPLEWEDRLEVYRMIHRDIEERRADLVSSGNTRELRLLDAERDYLEDLVLLGTKLVDAWPPGLPPGTEQMEPTPAPAPAPATPPSEAVRSSDQWAPAGEAPLAVEDLDLSLVTDLLLLSATSPWVVFVADKVQNTICYVSPSVRHLLQYKQAEFIGQVAHQGVHPDDIPNFQKMFQEVVRTIAVDSLAPSSSSSTVPPCAFFRRLRKDRSYATVQGTGRALGQHWLVWMELVLHEVPLLPSNPTAMAPVLPANLTAMASPPARDPLSNPNLTLTVLPTLPPITTGPVQLAPALPPATPASLLTPPPPPVSLPLDSATPSIQPTTSPFPPSLPTPFSLTCLPSMIAPSIMTDMPSLLLRGHMVTSLPTTRASMAASLPAAPSLQAPPPVDAPPPMSPFPIPESAFPITPSLFGPSPFTASPSRGSQAAASPTSRTSSRASTPDPALPKEQFRTGALGPGTPPRPAKQPQFFRLEPLHSNEGLASPACGAAGTPMAGGAPLAGGTPMGSGMPMSGGMLMTGLSSPGMSRQRGGRSTLAPLPSPSTPNLASMQSSWAASQSSQAACMSLLASMPHLPSVSPLASMPLLSSLSSLASMPLLANVSYIPNMSTLSTCPGIAGPPTPRLERPQMLAPLVTPVESVTATRSPRSTKSGPVCSRGSSPLHPERSPRSPRSSSSDSSVCGSEKDTTGAGPRSSHTRVRAGGCERWQGREGEVRNGPGREGHEREARGREVQEREAQGREVQEREARGREVRKREARGREGLEREARGREGQKGSQAQSFAMASSGLILGKNPQHLSRELRHHPGERWHPPGAAEREGQDAQLGRSSDRSRMRAGNQVREVAVGTRWEEPMNELEWLPTRKRVQPTVPPVSEGAAFLPSLVGGSSVPVVRGRRVDGALNEAQEWRGGYGGEEGGGLHGVERAEFGGARAVALAMSQIEGDVVKEPLRISSNRLLRASRSVDNIMLFNRRRCASSAGSPAADQSSRGSNHSSPGGDQSSPGPFLRHRGISPRRASSQRPSRRSGDATRWPIRKAEGVATWPENDGWRNGSENLVPGMVAEQEEEEEPPALQEQNGPRSQRDVRAPACGEEQQQQQTFWFRMASRITEAPPSFRTKGMRVLLVEDDPTVRTISQRLLEKLKCEVTITCNGKEAFKMMQSVLSEDLNRSISDEVPSAPFDVVLMDLNMPVMDGARAVDCYRQWEEDKCIPYVDRLAIFALTGNAERGDMIRCAESGFNGFIVKPLHEKRFVRYLYDFWQSAVPTKKGPFRKEWLQEI